MMSGVNKTAKEEPTPVIDDVVAPAEVKAEEAAPEEARQEAIEEAPVVEKDEPVAVEDGPAGGDKQEEMLETPVVNQE